MNLSATTPSTDAKASQSSAIMDQKTCLQRFHQLLQKMDDSDKITSPEADIEAIKNYIIIAGFDTIIHDGYDHFPSEKGNFSQLNY